jgi:hypothetical protein
MHEIVGNASLRALSELIIDGDDALHHGQANEL